VRSVKPDQSDLELVSNEDSVFVPSFDFVKVFSFQTQANADLAWDRHQTPEDIVVNNLSDQARPWFEAV
jgi:hypothetical protein